MKKYLIRFSSTVKDQSETCIRIKDPVRDYCLPKMFEFVTHLEANGWRHAEDIIYSSIPGIQSVILCGDVSPDYDINVYVSKCNA